MPRFERSDPSSNEFFKGRHRFEHWYRDNSVYFITARCRNRLPAFESESAKQIFWDRFLHYTRMHGFETWVVSLLDNHYHKLGYVKDASQLGEMMRKIHGSVAKLVNDLLPQRQVSFWGDGHHDDYFEGCIRDVLQLERAFFYTRDQAVRAGIVKDYREYSHTKICVERDVAIAKAIKLKAFMSNVPYQRYEKKRKRKRRGGGSGT
jgi:REP element-mobilizing transposase RayT